MAGPTSNLPSGLLDGFGIRDGSYPRTLSDQMIATFDLAEILSAANCVELVQVTTATAVVGALAGLQPSQGETLFIYGVAVSATTLVAEQISLALQVRNVGAAGAFLPVRSTDSDHPTAAGIYTGFAAFNSPFWLPTGSQLIPVVKKITTAATISVTISAAILRCRR